MAGKIDKKQLLIKVTIIAALALVIFLMIAFSNHPIAVEKYYSKGLYPFICRVLHTVFNIFPFSVGDVLYIVIIIYLVSALILLIKLAFKRHFFRIAALLLKMIISVQTGAIIFYLFWGLNYFRPSAGELLNLRDTSYTTASLKAVTAMLIDSANACRSRVTEADLRQNNDAIYQSAIQAVAKLSADSINFCTYAPGIKSSILTPLLNYMGTSGYYNPFTGEAQMNYEMPVFTRPLVACHELSHQMGFATEDEANFAGFLAGINAKDRLLRYSAYNLAVDEFMHALRYRDTAANNELKPRVSAAVHNDFKIERTYWMAYQSKLDVLSGIFYDNFLKANNQPHGLGTYNRMVLLVMARYGKPIVHGP